tara:strand:+ start:753 stop:2219 length:1467 start_codon:yes stop_codon:yes gene_type:complete
MAESFKLTRLPSLKTAADFRAYVAELGVEIPCDDNPDVAALGESLEAVKVNGKIVGNRFAIHPMEGWDGTATGGPTDEVRRRWKRFGESGAKLIYGGEAMAVRPEGRANPNQLIITKNNLGGLAELRDLLVAAHREKFGNAEDLVVGFQLTHSGRFCRPIDKARFEPQVAYRHPILDARFQVTRDDQVLTDDQVADLVGDFVRAARVARDAGADFVDIKHCHGYLLHEFLGAHTRPGRYGGSIENRTRILREIVAGIRSDGNNIDLGVRVSAFDLVPHRADPEQSKSGKLGPGVPEEFVLPYPFQFGIDHEDPTSINLSETFQFIELCAELGVKLLNISGGSPYYNPHCQRPAAYPPSDGYQPAHDPLIDVARLLGVARQLRTKLPTGMKLVGTGYSYLQEFLPHVAGAAVREGWADMAGLGRMVLSYPHLPADILGGEILEKHLICRTFSDCTTAPRNGLLSGCFPLDKFYADRAEATELKRLKRGR